MILYVPTETREAHPNVQPWHLQYIHIYNYFDNGVCGLTFHLHSRDICTDVAQNGPFEIRDVVEVPSRVDVVLQFLLLLLLIFICDTLSVGSGESTAMLTGVQVCTILHRHLKERGEGKRMGDGWWEGVDGGGRERGREGGREGGNEGMRGGGGGGGGGKRNRRARKKVWHAAWNKQ